MNCLTWVQADAFCRWAGRRLPTQAEMVWAAYGTSQSVYPWGGVGPTDDVADPNVCWQSASRTSCEVGSKPLTLNGAPSCFGVADIAGNVGELTSTLWQIPYVYPETSCLTTPNSKCAVMGGTYQSTGTSSFRSRFGVAALASDYANTVGFRCAK